LGIKKSQPASETANNEEPKVDEDQVKAEQERSKNLLEGLDKQYAVARAWTHTGRGRGLGFSE
jgi:hypothetical protein